MNGMKTVTRKILAGVTSMATLLTGAAFAISANAAEATATYNQADEFASGAVKGDKAAHLTVTKYLTNTPGQPTSTGSAQDAVANAKPGVGVTFTLTKIKSVGNHTPADYRNNNGELSATATPTADSAWQVTDTVYYGKTDAQGKITNWYADSAMTGSTVTNLAEDPTTHKTVRTYFVLQETDSPYGDYDRSENSVFDLPYRTTNVTTDSDGTVTNKEDGYVYKPQRLPKERQQQGVLQGCD